MAEEMDLVIERIRLGYDAFNRGDFDAAVDLLHPEIEWHRVAEFEQPLRGRQAVREFMDPEVFERQQTEILEIEVIGDFVLVYATFHGAFAGSGIELSQPGHHLWRIRDGQAAEFRYFLDRDEAVKAAEQG
jgi:ketosteroid isomerase-like protein